MKILLTLFFYVSFLFSYDYPNYRMDIFNDYGYQEWGYIDKKRAATNYFYAYYVDENYGQLGSITRQSILNTFIDKQIDFKIADFHERLIDIFMEFPLDKDLSYNKAVSNVRKNAPEYAFLNDIDAVLAVRYRDYIDMNTSSFEVKTKLEKEFEEYRIEKDNLYSKAKTKAIVAEIAISIIVIVMVAISVRSIKKIGKLILPIKRNETTKRVVIMASILWVIGFSIDYRIIDWFSHGVDAEDFNQYFIVTYLPMIILYGIYWVINSIKPLEVSSD